MADDLGAGAGEVHALAGAVLDFWFDEVPEDKHFTKDATLDRSIAERFGALRDRVLATDAAGWRDDPDTLLAAIILIDQFSRNMHRDTFEAFAGDPLALALTHEAIDKGWDHDVPASRRAYLYMPLMHAEDRDEQALSVRCFEDLGDAYNLKFARAHAAVIDRFGRFPSRNAALGRRSTPEEAEYLSQPGAGW